jgi:hypothetical protein
MYEMEGPHYGLAAPPRRSLDAARVAWPTTYLEDLAACPGCPELALGARFAPVSRPDPNPATATDHSVSMPRNLFRISSEVSFGFGSPLQR